LLADLFADGDAEDEIEFRTPIIEDTIYPDATGIIGGQSGAGKTFVVASLCVAIAGMDNWLGRNVLENGGVLILDGESGDNDLRARIRAAKLGAGLRGALPVMWKVNTKNLFDPDNFKIALDAIEFAKGHLKNKFGADLKMVVLDTMSSTMTLGDEGAKEMKAASECLEALREVARIPTVWGVHHYGKDAEKGNRGHSNLRGLTDQGLAVMAQRDTSKPGELMLDGKRWVSMERNRWGREGRICDFKLPEMLVGKRTDGKEVFCPYVKPVVEPDWDSMCGKRTKLTVPAERVLDGIKAAIDSGLGFDYPISGSSRDDMVTVRAVTKKDILNALLDKGLKYDVARKAFPEGPKELTEKGVIKTGMYRTDDIYWLA
jgi:hypothetical protein